MINMKLNELSDKQQNIYRNLEMQVNSFFNRTNEKAFKTRDRYRDGMKDFAKFLARDYRKENIKTIKNKHLQAYVNHMQKNKSEYSTSYITTNMSAIRFFYERVSNGKMQIKSNRQLGVTPRTQDERIGLDRSMNNTDYKDLLQTVENQGKITYSQILQLAKVFGLRLHESFSLRKSQINKALRENEIEVKGKGGLIRRIPIPIEGRVLLEEIKSHSKTGTDRIFINKDGKTHKEMKKFQNFIRESKKSGPSLTYHSLRHTYAQELYRRLMNSSLSELEARKIVSKRLGHNRIDITNVYLNR